MMKISFEEIIKDALGDKVINLIYDRDKSMVLIKKRLDLFRDELTQMLLYKALPRDICMPADYHNIDDISDIYKLLSEINVRIVDVVNPNKQSLFSLKNINTMNKKDQLDIVTFYKYQLSDVYSQLKLMLTLEFVNHDKMELKLEEHTYLPGGRELIYPFNTIIKFSDTTLEGKDYKLTLIKARAGKNEDFIQVPQFGVRFEDGKLIVEDGTVNLIKPDPIVEGITINIPIFLEDHNNNKYNIGYVALQEDLTGFNVIVQPLSYPISRGNRTIGANTLIALVSRLTHYIYINGKLSKKPEMITIPIGVVDDIILRTDK